MGKLTTNRSRFSPTESVLTSATKCDIIYTRKVGKRYDIKRIFGNE